MKESRTQTVFYRTTGASDRCGSRALSECSELPCELRHALLDLHGFDPILSPPQEEALVNGIAEKNGKDFLVCAPTNSGKTLIAVFRIFSSALKGGLRSVYVVPLKALAEEKFEEFTRLANRIEAKGGKSIKISITTGDYQLTRDFLGSPPPEAGEIVICTPERLEVMLRNPDNLEWARAIGTYVLDEFHLLGDRRRGKTMELLVSRLLASCPWSSILSLSATVGGRDRIQRWLTHTGRTLNLIESDYRFPRLVQEVMVTSEKDGFIEEYAREVAGDPDRALLVFVANKAATRKLAETLEERSGIPGLVDFFNAGIPSASRKQKAERFRHGGPRILVTTTSLKMGVNFPVTDVIIRDQTLHGGEGSVRLSYADVMQMMGRAGRGMTPGKGILLCGTREESNRYRELFEADQSESLEPQLIPKTTGWRQRNRQPDQEINPMNGVVLTEVALRKETKLSEIRTFLTHTYSAQEGTINFGGIGERLEFLHRVKLIFPVENATDRWEATKLGRTVARSGLSPESGAILAGLLRALINLSEKEREESGRSGDYLRRLSNFDFLFLAVSAFESRDHWLPSPDPDEIAKTREYVEGLSAEQKPLLNRWRSEDSRDFPTRRLLSTLKVPHEIDTPGSSETAFYRIMRTATVLHRHANGEGLAALARDYSRGNRMVSEGDLESGLKFSATWVLNCLAQICDPKKCYNLNALKMKLIDLLEDLSLGSQLGKLLLIKGVGRRTVEHLISNGIETMEGLSGFSQDKLTHMGIQTKQAASIIRHVQRRTR
jgi:helicase